MENRPNSRKMWEAVIYRSVFVIKKDLAFRTACRSLICNKNKIEHNYKITTYIEKNI